MYISRVVIKNFKKFRDFTFEPNEKINIIVGDNNEGKSTILEAIHLALTGYYEGNCISNNITQDIFNNGAVNEYLNEIKSNKTIAPPKVTIELYLNDYPDYKGMNNSLHYDGAAIIFEIEFDSNYQSEYNKFLEDSEEIESIPIEFYKTRRYNSKDSDSEIMARSLPLKSVLIDSTKEKNTSYDFVNNLIRENLEEKQINDISMAFRKSRENFIKNKTVIEINKSLGEKKHFMNHSISIDMNMPNKTDWKSTIITKVNNFPYQNAGNGEKSSVKIELALNKSEKIDNKVILIEEPENHLSSGNLNRLLKDIAEKENENQIFVTTHSSFVANKLNLSNLILINDSSKTNFSDISEETKSFFEKRPGYDTLRFILCRKAVLVEGDADELIFQKAYQDKNNKLPIEDDVDIISVGTSFLRFLEFDEKLKKEIYVLTDNDGDVDALEKKYEKYMNKTDYNFIHISYDKETHKDYGQLKKKNGDSFNYDTLEPCIVRANSTEIVNNILQTSFSDEDELIKYMVNNKTECALKIFESNEKIIFPEYIQKVVDEI